MSNYFSLDSLSIIVLNIYVKVNEISCVTCLSISDSGTNVVSD